VMGEQKKITSQWYPVEKSGTIFLEVIICQI
jgi:hypothetical protein